MLSRTVIIYMGFILTVTLPFWYIIPIVGFILELAMMVGLAVSVIERKWLYVILAPILGLIIGAIPGLAAMPLASLLSVLMKAVVPPIALGLCINNGLKASLSFLVASALIMVITLGYYIEFREAINATIKEATVAAGETFKTYMAPQGYSADVINQIIDRLETLQNMTIRLMPALLMLVGIGEVLAVMILISWHYTRTDGFFPGFGPFIYWKMPEKLLYLWAVAIAMRLLFGGATQIIADNLLLILISCYSVCGFSLIEYLLKKLRLPIFIKVIFYIGLLLMQLPGFIVTAIVGLFDSYFDFRKVRAHTIG